MQGLHHRPPERTETEGEKIITYKLGLTVLGSGSSGNSAVISTPKASILVDAGLSGKKTISRLREAGEELGKLKAIVITHEHGDHIQSLEYLAGNLHIPAYLSGGTKSTQTFGRKLDIRIVDPGKAFSIGDVDVMPFLVPHDAAEPCGYTFSTGGVKFGIVADCGYLTPGIKSHLGGCDMLMLEANHDLAMMEAYTEGHHNRLISRTGHMSNDSICDFIQSDYDGAAKYMVLAHISSVTNSRELAVKQVQKAMRIRKYKTQVVAAEKSKPTAKIYIP